MKQTIKNRQQLTFTKVIMASLLILGLLSACAAPTSTNSVQSEELDRLRQMNQQQQDALLAVQQQLAELQQQMGIVPAPEPSDVELQAEEASLIPGSEEVETLVAAATSYLEAFSALAMGRYEQAQNGFNAFLQDFMEHRYAPNARYWLAETEIALGLLHQAENNLLIIANDPENESKAPAALSRLAQIYQQQNLTEQAEDILQQLQTRFPESREAQHFNRSDQTQ